MYNVGIRWMANKGPVEPMFKYKDVWEYAIHDDRVVLYFDWGSRTLFKAHIAEIMIERLP